MSATAAVGREPAEKPQTRGRDSSASSGSSSETLKWRGSNSDLSTVSSVGGSSSGGGHHRGSAQLIAHSAKVSAPQRHHSESVQAVTDGWPAAGGVGPHDVALNCRNGGVCSSQRNMRKLFPVSTYTVQPAAVPDEKTSPKYASRPHCRPYWPLGMLELSWEVQARSNLKKHKLWVYTIYKQESCFS